MNTTQVDSTSHLKDLIESQQCMILNNNGFDYGFDNLVAINNSSEHFSVDDFSELQSRINLQQSTLFGYLSYDLKNKVENLESNNRDLLKWPEILMFEAEKVQPFRPTILNQSIKPNQSISMERVHPLISKEEYLKKVARIKEYILEGEIYELNFCIPFVIEAIDIDPFQVYSKLNSVSPMPFSAFFKTDNKYIISASPERFIKREANQIISQPMKGTIKRSKDSEEDERLKTELQCSEKERAENLMIVDLVRHDLKKSCNTGTIEVDNLFEVLSYKQVHQLVSTIKGQLKEGISVSEIIKNCFPMGSMTGAPKIRSMQLIEELEVCKRGPFSGALGYIEPSGNFDFSVLIRSIFYDSDLRLLTFQAGSAITLDSDPDREYQECMLKAEAIFGSLFLS